MDTLRFFRRYRMLRGKWGGIYAGTFVSLYFILNVVFHLERCISSSWQAYYPEFKEPFKDVEDLWSRLRLPTLPACWFIFLFVVFQCLVRPGGLFLHCIPTNPNPNPNANANPNLVEIQQNKVLTLTLTLTLTMTGWCPFIRSSRNSGLCRSLPRLSKKVGS